MGRPDHRLGFEAQWPVVTTDVGIGARRVGAARSFGRTARSLGGQSGGHPRLSFGSSFLFYPLLDKKTDEKHFKTAPGGPPENFRPEALDPPAHPVRVRPVQRRTVRRLGAPLPRHQGKGPGDSGSAETAEFAEDRVRFEETGFSTGRGGSGLSSRVPSAPEV